MDGHGEIVRVGEPRALLEGRFRDTEERAAAAPHKGVLTIAGDSFVNNAQTAGGALLMGGHSHAQNMSVAMGVGASADAGAGGIAPYRLAAEAAMSATAGDQLRVEDYAGHALMVQQCLFLRCGVEIRSYILNRHAELSGAQLEQRCVEIQAPEKPYDPYADLVAGDLADIPAVLNSIDKGIIFVLKYIWLSSFMYFFSYYYKYLFIFIFIFICRNRIF